MLWTTVPTPIFVILILRFLPCFQNHTLVYKTMFFYFIYCQIKFNLLRLFAFDVIYLVYVYSWSLNNNIENSYFEFVHFIFNFYYLKIYTILKFFEIILIRKIVHKYYSLHDLKIFTNMLQIQLWIITLLCLCNFITFLVVRAYVR